MFDRCVCDFVRPASRHETLAGRLVLLGLALVSSASFPVWMPERSDLESIVALLFDGRVPVDCCLMASFQPPCLLFDGLVPTDVMHVKLMLLWLVSWCSVVVVGAVAVGPSLGYTQFFILGRAARCRLGLVLDAMCFAPACGVALCVVFGRRR